MHKHSSVESSPEEIDAVVHAAAHAAAAYAALPAARRAEFLDEIAVQIEALGDALIECARAETSLTLPRLQGERARTCGQLRMFANVVREGAWLDARIETADPTRAAGPKPDLRRMLVPLGPVAVFGASNFPFAFSVAGGDTASALAAGCPVVVKAHPAHPETSLLTAGAVLTAVEKCGIPAGTFGMVEGGISVGERLVQAPEITAVGFTGSLGGGRALFNLAAARPRPIPVYAEMGSVNPLFVLPGAIEERGAAFAKGYADSLTLGVGQFCTNPGVLVGMAGAAFDELVGQIAGHLSSAPPGTMLHAGIHRQYESGVKEREAHSKLTGYPRGSCGEGVVVPALFATTAADFLSHADLREELFGPSAIAVACTTVAEMHAVALALEGQLTASLHAASSDAAEAQALMPLLTRIAGRVLAAGFPTGLEVGPATQHGGPYPATTDSRSTSVGTAAILRFARPVTYQDMPQEFLPDELKDGNPRGIRRLVNGVLEG